MRTIQEILEQLRVDEVIPPGDLADYRLRVSAEFGFISQKLTDILKRKAGVWLEIRQRTETKSDKMADKIWDTTEDGRNEIEYRSVLKYLEKIMSAISTRLKIYEQESRNQF